MMLAVSSPMTFNFVGPEEATAPSGATAFAPMTTPRSPEHEARIRAMVTANFEFIWRTLRGLGVPQSGADDAAQQVFLIASQKLESIGPGCERAFLFSTARGVAANARRAIVRNREQPDESALAHKVDEAPDPEVVAQKNQGKKLLERILAGMTEDLRTVFILFELEGLTSVEIAALLEIPVGTAASRLRRAREEFQLAVTELQLGGRR
jgi:RNA polymerase sigma-70 factor (ECF subfamily)